MPPARAISGYPQQAAGLVGASRSPGMAGLLLLAAGFVVAGGTGCLQTVGIGSLQALPGDAGALTAGVSCGADGQCQSGICGVSVSHTGNCCSTACATSDGICGATACDDAGACVYPGALICNDAGPCVYPGSVPCRPDSCSAGVLTHSVCSGAGVCSPSSTLCPTNQVCDREGTACVFDICGGVVCAGGFCDPVTGACCAGLYLGGSLYVDGVAGHDGIACCGFGGTEPCLTVTRAMGLVDSAGAQDVTIVATLDGGGGDWAAPETYPIVLGWGVELSAPGVVFHLPDADAGDLLDVRAYSSRDELGSASVVGSATSPLGLDSAVDGGDAGAILVETTLYLANASLTHGGISIFGQVLHVGDGGVYPYGILVLGADRAGVVTGTVYVTDSPRYGILCDQCTIRDVELNGESSLVLRGAALMALGFPLGAHIPPHPPPYPYFSTGPLSVSLLSNPVVGVPPSGVGVGTCAEKYIGDGIVIDGTNGEFTFKNGVIQCIGGSGLTATGSQIIVDNTVIQNAGIGISSSVVATVSVTNSLIRYNGIGIVQSCGWLSGIDTSADVCGTIDLGGGGNTVICSSNVESTSGSTWPGIDAWNASTLDLNASNVAWDTAGPDYFSCDASGPDGGFLSCSCNLASCSTAPGADGMNAVATNDGGIILTGHTLSPERCLP
jgi:hypothetical protein